MSARRARRGAGREAGAALVSAVTISVVLTALAVAALATVPSTLRAISERIERSAARYQALGGAAYAVRRVEQGKSGSISSAGGSARGPGQLGPALSAQQLAAAPDGTYTVTETRLSDGSRLLAASAKRGRATVTLRMVLRPASASPFRQAAVGLSGVRLRGAVLSDGYDSARGAYADQAQAKAGGVVAALETGTIVSNGSILLASGDVFGRVAPGPEGSLDPGQARITGSTAPLGAPFDAPELSLDALTGDASSPGSGPASTPAPSKKSTMSMTLDAATADSLSTGTEVVAAPPATTLAFTSGSFDLAPGSYDVDELRVTGATVRIRGDVVVRARRSFEVGAGGSISLEQGGSLRVQADGALVIAGDGIRNLAGPAPRQKGGGKAAPEGDPLRLTIVATTDPAAPPPATRIATATPFFGAIYAPGRALSIEGSAAIFGAAIADSIASEAALALHFDAALSRVDVKGAPATRYDVAASWSAP